MPTRNPEANVTPPQSPGGLAMGEHRFRDSAAGLTP
jgi:hypothetical protein